MAKEEKKKDKKEKHHHHSKGEMSFGLEVFLFVVAIFILWLVTGGAKKETPTSPLLVPKIQTNN